MNLIISIITFILKTIFFSSEILFLIIISYLFLFSSLRITPVIVILLFLFILFLLIKNKKNKINLIIIKTIDFIFKYGIYFIISFLFTLLYLNENYNFLFLIISLFVLNYFVILLLIYSNYERLKIYNIISSTFNLLLFEILILFFLSLNSNDKFYYNEEFDYNHFNTYIITNSLKQQFINHYLMIDFWENNYYVENYCYNFQCVNMNTIIPKDIQSVNFLKNNLNFYELKKDINKTHKKPIFLYKNNNLCTINNYNEIDSYFFNNYFFLTIENNKIKFKSYYKPPLSYDEIIYEIEKIIKQCEN